MPSIKRTPGKEVQVEVCDADGQPVSLPWTGQTSEASPNQTNEPSLSTIPHLPKPASLVGDLNTSTADSTAYAVGGITRESATPTPIKLTSEKAREMIMTRWERTDEMERECVDLWNSLTIEEAMKRLAFLRGEAERGSNIINARISSEHPGTVSCFICSRVDADTKMVACITERTDSGIYVNVFCCSANCYAKYVKQRNNKKRQAVETPVPGRENEVPAKT